MEDIEWALTEIESNHTAKFQTDTDHIDNDDNSTIMGHIDSTTSQGPKSQSDNITPEGATDTNNLSLQYDNCIVGQTAGSSNQCQESQTDNSPATEYKINSNNSAENCADNETIMGHTTTFRESQIDNNATTDIIDNNVDNRPIMGRFASSNSQGMKFQVDNNTLTPESATDTNNLSIKYDKTIVGKAACSSNQIKESQADNSPSVVCKIDNNNSAENAMNKTIMGHITNYSESQINNDATTDSIDNVVDNSTIMGQIDSSTIQGTKSQIDNSITSESATDINNLRLRCDETIVDQTAGSSYQSQESQTDNSPATECKTDNSSPDPDPDNEAIIRHITNLSESQTDYKPTAEYQTDSNIDQAEYDKKILTGPIYSTNSRSLENKIYNSPTTRCYMDIYSGNQCAESQIDNNPATECQTSNKGNHRVENNDESIGDQIDSSISQGQGLRIDKDTTTEFQADSNKHRVEYTVNLKTIMDQIDSSNKPYLQSQFDNNPAIEGQTCSTLFHKIESYVDDSICCLADSSRIQGRKSKTDNKPTAEFQTDTCNHIVSQIDSSTNPDSLIEKNSNAECLTDSKKRNTDYIVDNKAIEGQAESDGVSCPESQTDKNPIAECQTDELLSHSQICNVGKIFSQDDRVNNQSSDMQTGGYNRRSLACSADSMDYQVEIYSAEGPIDDCASDSMKCIDDGHNKEINRQMQKVAQLSSLGTNSNIDSDPDYDGRNKKTNVRKQKKAQLFSFGTNSDIDSDPDSEFIVDSHNKETSIHKQKKSQLFSLGTNSDRDSDPDSEIIEDSHDEEEDESDEGVLKVSSLLDSIHLRKRFRLKESEIVRDINLPGIYMRKHRKSTKCSKAQLHKKKEANTRVYDNYHACPYCGELRQHLKVHLKVHKEKIPEVQDLLKLKNADISKVRKEGDHKHNCKVLRDECGELILSRRPKVLDTKNVGPCPNCHEWLLLHNLKMHYKQCVKEKEVVHKRKLVVQSQVLSGVISSKPSALMLNEVFPSMLTDPIGNLAKEDPLIIALGESWLRRSVDNKSKRRHYTSQHMRLMARMVQEMKLLDKEEDINSQRTKLADFLETKHFNTCVGAALNCCVPYMDDVDDLRSPSNGIKIKYDLQRVVSARWAMLVKEDPHSEKAQEMEIFQKLISREWGERITKLSRSVMVRRQLMLKNELPSPEDIKTLTAYLDSGLKKTPLTSGNYRRIVQLVETRLLTYNKRRSGEIEAISLQQYAERSQNLNDVDESLLGELSEMEKYLLKTQDLMKVRGKGNRPVPVLIPAEVRKPLEFISDKQNRRKANIKDSNMYLFPNSELSYARSYDSLKKTCGECALSAPSRITSVAMRKYTATLTQMMNLEKYQIEWLCRHLGHTSDIHKTYYRQMSGLVERVEIGKLFLIQDLNLQNKFKGKTLDQVDISDLVFADVEGGNASGEKAGTSETVADHLVVGQDDQHPDLVDPIVFDDQGSSSEDESEPLEDLSRKQKEKKKKKPVTRQYFDEEEMNEIHHYFKQYLNSGICPRTAAVNEAKKRSKQKGGKLFLRSADKIIKKISNMNHKKN